MCQKKQNDTEIFNNAQKVYLSKKSSKKKKLEAWGIMFEKVRNCCSVQCMKLANSCSSSRLGRDNREDFVSEAAIKIMNRYKKAEKKGEEYRIHYLTTVCYLACKCELFCEKSKRARNIITWGAMGDDLEIFITKYETKEGRKNGAIWEKLF